VRSSIVIFLELTVLTYIDRESGLQLALSLVLSLRLLTCRKENGLITMRRLTRRLVLKI
jgi:hypothetical protein